LHRGTPGHMRLPHRLKGQKVNSQGGAGAYCGGNLAAQLVITVIIISVIIIIYYYARMAANILQMYMHTHE